jgi:hypothetical protein
MSYGKPERPKTLATFDVVTPVETSQKNTHWFNLGRAWETELNGKRRILVKLNAHPMGNTLYLFEKGEEGARKLPDGNSPDNDGMLDEIPH